MSRRAESRGLRRRWPRRWVLVVLLALAAWGVWRLGWVDRAALEQVAPAWVPRAAGREVTVYFADPRWTRLVPEPRRLKESAEPLAAVRALVQALAEGPRGEASAVLPREARLRGAYLGADGLAVLDFEPQVAEFAYGGSSGELLAVMALVQTIQENVPGVTAVQILIGGEARETLAGHVKISEPLAPDPAWQEPASR